VRAVTADLSAPDPGSLIQFPAAANLSGRFEAVYRPELVDGPVVFTDYVLVADNRRP
jgi:hypothetical protein